MPGRNDSTKTPYGLWAILGLIESVLNTSLDTGAVENNLIVADLVQFEDEELSRVRHTTELTIVAAQEVQALLSKYDVNKVNTPLIQDSLPGSDMYKTAEQIIESAYSDTIEAGNIFRLPLQVADTAKDAQWSIRQALSLVEALISSIDLPKGTAKQIVLTRLEPYQSDQFRWLFHATELVIMAAALVLLEIDGMKSPPGTYPLNRRRRRLPKRT